MIVVFQADPNNEQIRLDIRPFGHKKAEGQSFNLEDLPREVEKVLDIVDDPGFLIDAVDVESKGGEILSSYHLLSLRRSVILYESKPGTRKLDIIEAQEIPLTGFILTTGERRRA